MTASAKTLRALERAAMKWFEHADGFDMDARACLQIINSKFLCKYFEDFKYSCARHAAALKRKRTGRR